MTSSVTEKTTITYVDYIEIEKAKAELEESGETVESDGFFRKSLGLLIPPATIEKTQLSEGAYFLFSHIYYYINLPIIGQERWKLSKAHMFSLYRKQGHGKKFFNNRWDELKKKGFLTQFRIPKGIKDGKKNVWVYEYVLNVIPNLKWDGCVTCFANGTPVPGQEAVRTEEERAYVRNKTKKFLEKSKEHLENTIKNSTAVEEENAEKAKNGGNSPALSPVPTYEVAEETIKTSVNYKKIQANLHDKYRSIKLTAVDAILSVFKVSYQSRKINGKLVPLDDIKRTMIMLTAPMLEAVAKRAYDRFDTIKDPAGYLITSAYNEIRKPSIEITAEMLGKEAPSYNLAKYEEYALKHTPKL